jgi:hypothetical protein
MAGYVYADDSGFLRIVDLATGEQIGSDVRDPVPIHSLASAEVSGRTCVVASGGDTVRVWDLTDIVRM